MLDIKKLIIISVFIGIILPLSLVATRWYLMQPPDNVVLDNGVKLEWSPCWFEVPIDKIIHCARVYPSLQNKDHSVSLPVVVYKDYSFGHKPDPVMFINGGPGSSSWLDEENWSYYVEVLGWKRDFIVFDHRGTGLSQPKPECKSLFDYYYASLTKSISAKQEIRTTYNKTANCYRDLVKQGHDFKNYSTFHSTQDVQDIVEVMDYAQWNLYGTSYGTRVALEVLRKNPDNIRSVILDSVYPSDKHSLQTWPKLFDGVMASIYKYCKGNKECNDDYPDLPALFKRAMKNLKDKPVKVHLANYYDDGALDVYINDYRFATALYMAMYNPNLIKSMPEAIDGAAYRSAYPMKVIVEAYADFILDQSFNDATYFSVECNDKALISEEAYNKEIKKYPRYREFFKHDWQYAPCRAWQTGSTKRISTKPVKSKIPTLILSGELDPVTPWQWGKEVHKNLSNSSYYTFKGTAHDVLGTNDCAVQISRDFLDNLYIKQEPVCLQN